MPPPNGKNSFRLDLSLWSEPSSFSKAAHLPKFIIGGKPAVHPAVWPRGKLLKPLPLVARMLPLFSPANRLSSLLKFLLLYRGKEKPWKPEKNLPILPLRIGLHHPLIDLLFKCRSLLF